MDDYEDNDWSDNDGVEEGIYKSFVIVYENIFFGGTDNWCIVLWKWGKWE